MEMWLTFRPKTLTPELLHSEREASLSVLVSGLFRAERTASLLTETAKISKAVAWEAIYTDTGRERAVYL